MNRDAFRFARAGFAPIGRWVDPCSPTHNLINQIKSDQPVDRIPTNDCRLLDRSIGGERDGWRAPVLDEFWFLGGLFI